MAQGYANPNALVTTEWVAEHDKDPGVRVLEPNEDVLRHDLAHVPGAPKIHRQAGLNGAKRGERTAQLPGNRALVDVRSPGEFSGQVTHMPDYPQEGVLRGGHIPGAQSIPWAQAANPDQTFKSAEELTALYAGKGVTPDKEVIAYCRIGERSSHTWFVLHELLGYPSVRNYDGSWTEWGNSVRVPVEKA